MGLKVERQQDIPIEYNGKTFEEGGLRLDLLVEDKQIIEVKAEEIVNPVGKEQIISHLMLTGKRLGYLFYFNVPLIKE
jgi:GxxExxY protein